MPNNILIVIWHIITRRLGIQMFLARQAVHLWFIYDASSSAWYPSQDSAIPSGFYVPWQAKAKIFVPMLPHCGSPSVQQAQCGIGQYIGLLNYCK